MTTQANGFLATGYFYDFLAYSGDQPTWAPTWGFVTSTTKDPDTSNADVFPRGESPMFRFGGSFGGWRYGAAAYGGDPDDNGNVGPAVNDYSSFAGVFGTGVYVTGVAGTSTNGVGVYGQTGDIPPPVPNMSPAAVVGLANPGNGVVGVSTGGTAVWGVTYQGDGVVAESSIGRGVVGSSYFNCGVAGYSNRNFGVLGQSGDSGVQGVSLSPGPTPADLPIAGVFGTSAPNVGVLGTSAQSVGVAGISDALFGVYGRSNKNYAGFFEGNLFVRDAIFAGTKDAIVPFPDGSKRLLHCMESPEHWFEDFGAARLKRGRAMVKLDVDFAKVIKRGDYKVFLTPEGDCRGLYVRKSAASFEVREFAGGKSSVAFSYRIVGRRKDIRDHRRFAKFDVPVPTPAPRARRPSLTRAAFIADLERQARARATPSMRRSDREAAATPPAPARLIPGGRPPARRR